MKDIFIVDGRRTAIGTFGGSLREKGPIELGTQVARELVEQTGVDPATIDASVFASVIPTEGRDFYMSRVVGINAGMPASAHSMNVNRLCGSGVQAIVSAAQMIELDDASVALVGGGEVMSRAPYSVERARHGLSMGNGVVYDWLNGGLCDPFDNGLMGNTAENIADKYGISRERQDEFAYESQRRAQQAIERGAFSEQISPVELTKRGVTTVFDTDEHPRVTSPEKLAKLKPHFREGGTVTAGNSSGINDAASVLLLAEGDAASKQELNPMARIVSWGIAGVDPAFMGLGPVEAVPIALKRAGLKLEDISVIESNEAFAAQALAVSDQLGFDPERVNPNGGAIALGHPVAATGGILTIKTLYELKQRGERYGLITMCIGGGQGIALVVEAV